MPAKIITRRKVESPSKNRIYGRQLLSLVEDHRALTKRLVDLIEQLEDEEDHRLIEAAIKENAGKPGLPWEEAKKKLGLKFD